MHHDYFEWAPCMETFGFFAKCVVAANAYILSQMKNPFTAFETVSKWYSLVAVVNIKRNVFYKIRKYSKRNAFAVFSCQDVSAKYADEYKKQQLIESIFKYFIFIWERKKS